MDRTVTHKTVKYKRVRYAVRYETVRYKTVMPPHSLHSCSAGDRRLPAVGPGIRQSDIRQSDSRQSWPRTYCMHAALVTAGLPEGFED